MAELAEVALTMHARADTTCKQQGPILEKRRGHTKKCRYPTLPKKTTANGLDATNRRLGPSTLQGKDGMAAYADKRVSGLRSRRILSAGSFRSHAHIRLSLPLLIMR